MSLGFPRETRATTRRMRRSARLRAPLDARRWTSGRARRAVRRHARRAHAVPERHAAGGGALHAARHRATRRLSAGAPLTPSPLPPPTSSPSRSPRARPRRARRRRPHDDSTGRAPSSARRGPSFARSTQIQLASRFPGRRPSPRSPRRSRRERVGLLRRVGAHAHHERGARRRSPRARRGRRPSPSAALFASSAPIHSSNASAQPELAVRVLVGRAPPGAERGERGRAHRRAPARARATCRDGGSARWSSAALAPRVVDRGPPAAPSHRVHEHRPVHVRRDERRRASRAGTARSAPRSCSRSPAATNTSSGRSSAVVPRAQRAR